MQGGAAGGTGLSSACDFLQDRMPRFFFHFTRQNEPVPEDPYGLELSDLRVAHRHAVRLAERTVRLTSSRCERRGRLIQVTDGKRPLLTVLVPAELPQPTDHVLFES